MTSSMAGGMQHNDSGMNGSIFGHMNPLGKHFAKKIIVVKLQRILKNMHKVIS